MKTTKECPSCAMEVEDHADICPICQYEFPKQPKSIQWVAILLLIALLLWFLL